MQNLGQSIAPKAKDTGNAKAKPSGKDGEFKLSNRFKASL